MSRYSLRDLFWLILVIACMCGWSLHAYRHWNQVETATQRVRELEDYCQNNGLPLPRPGEYHGELLPTNIRALPAHEMRGPPPPPKYQELADRLDLQDLELTFLPVQFTTPIQGRSRIFFSETEITNGMFAIYLQDSNQWRDDTETEEHEKRRNTGVRNPDGSLSFQTSTGSASLHIREAASLWRQGTFPNGREDHPVTFLNIGQAAEFCQWLSKRYDVGGVFRLPTEDEWLFAAYGTNRKYPWGDDLREWSGESTEPVKSRPALRTPDGLFGMWGNVSELVLSPWNGYGGRLKDEFSPVTTQWLGTSYQDDEVRGYRAQPRQDDWGYNHSKESKSDTWGIRVVFVPEGY